MKPGPDNTLAVNVPVVLQEGHGAATVHFTWDSRSLASVVCKDFEVTKRLDGEVISREYPVAGAFQLTGLDRTSPTAITGVLKGDEIHLAGMASTGILKVRGNEMTGTLQRGDQPARVIARRQMD